MSRANELLAIVNKELGGKEEVAFTADNEMYRAGYWPTGIMPIDAVLGGGIAKGRMMLASGESQTLKSLIGLSTAAQVQRLGGTAAIIDTEHAFNQEWAEGLGLNLSELILMQPKTGELALDQVRLLVSNEIDFVCFDSIATMLPKSEAELQLSGKDNNQPARIAALMALALRQINTSNSKTAIMWITQMRDNIGAMPMMAKTIATGGKSIHYYVSQSIGIKKTGKITEDVTYFNGEKDDTAKQQVAQKFRVELLKSRNKQPFEIQNFVYDYQTGEIDHTLFLMGQGLDLGIITKAGAWWTFTDVDEETGEVRAEHKAGSRDKFRELVYSSPEVYHPLIKKVCARYKLDSDAYYQHFKELTND